MAILDSTVVAVAQRTFVTDFNSTQAVVAWTVAGYMLAFATVIPITGWAADRFGTKRLFMGSVVRVHAGLAAVRDAPNILLLIMFRVVQGVGGGMLVPLSFVILTREAGPKRLGRLVAIGGIPILLGPIGGPILGGWLVGAYGWEWIFLINLPIGLIALVLAAITFPEDRPCPGRSTRHRQRAAAAARRHAIPGRSVVHSGARHGRRSRRVGTDDHRAGADRRIRLPLLSHRPPAH